MPPMRISRVVWNANAAYATRRATTQEIEDVLLDHTSRFRRNLPGRVASHVAIGRTREGRRLAVAFIYRSNGRVAVPISTWEDR
jgi:hypothetical protein